MGDSPPYAHNGRRRSSPGIVFTNTGEHPFTFGSPNPNDSTALSESSSQSNSQFRGSGKRTSLVVANRRFSSPREFGVFAGSSQGATSSPTMPYSFQNRSQNTGTVSRNNPLSGGNTPSDYPPRKESTATTVAFAHRDSVGTHAGFRDDDIGDERGNLSIADSPTDGCVSNGGQQRITSGLARHHFSLSTSRGMKDSTSFPATGGNSPNINMSPMSVFLGSVAAGGVHQGPIGSASGYQGLGSSSAPMSALLHDVSGVIIHDSSSTALSPNTIGNLSMSARPLSIAESRRRSSSSQQSQRPAPLGFNSRGPSDRHLLSGLQSENTNLSPNANKTLSNSSGHPAHHNASGGSVALEAMRLKMTIPVLRKYLVDELKVHANEARRNGRDSTTQLTFGNAPIGRNTSVTQQTVANHTSTSANVSKMGPLYDASDATDLSLMHKRIPAWMVDGNDPAALPSIQRYFSIKDKQRREKALANEKKLAEAEAEVDVGGSGGIGGSGLDSGSDQPEDALLSPRLNGSNGNGSSGGIKGHLMGLVQTSRLGLDHRTLAKMQTQKQEPVSPYGRPRRTMLGGSWDSPFDTATKNSKPSTLLVEGGGASFVSSVAYNSPYVQKILAPLIKQSKERERLLESTGGNVESPFETGQVRPTLSINGVTSDLLVGKGSLMENNSFASSAMLATPALAVLALANSVNTPSATTLGKDQSGHAYPSMSQSFSGRGYPFGIRGGLRRRSSVEGSGGANKKPLSSQDHLVATVLLEEGERKKKTLLAATSRPQAYGSSNSLTKQETAEGTMGKAPSSVMDALEEPDMDLLAVPLLAKLKEKLSPATVAQYEDLAKLEQQNKWLVEPGPNDAATRYGSRPSTIANTGEGGTTTPLKLRSVARTISRTFASPTPTVTHSQTSSQTMAILNAPDHYHERYDSTAMPTRHLLQQRMREGQLSANAQGPTSGYLQQSTSKNNTKITYDYSDLRFDDAQMLTEANVRSGKRVAQRSLGILMKCIEDAEDIARRQIILAAGEEARVKAAALDAEFEQTNRWKRPYKPKLRS